MAGHKAKPARKTHYTHAQNQQFKAWLKAHPLPPARSARQQPAGGTAASGGRRSGGGRHSHHGRHGLALPGSPTGPLCAATAVAVSLLLATGRRATSGDIEALHAAAGGDGDGAPLASVLAAARREGVAGVTLAAVTPSPLHDGALLSVALEDAQADQGIWEDEPSPWWGLHAMVLNDGHALTWGRAIPIGEGFLARQTLGAWALKWGLPRCR